MEPDLPMSIDETNETVGAGRVQTVAELVVAGKSFPQAAREAGVTKTDLATLVPAVKERVRVMLEAFTVDDDVQKKLVRARLTEFLLSDDPDVAMHAIRETKKLHGMDQTPMVQFQFTRPPEADNAWKAVEESEPPCPADEKSK